MLPEDGVGAAHHLVITTVFDDGHESTWTYYNQPRTAREAHDNLAARWKAAGYEFERDKTALTLSRQCPDLGYGPYVDHIAHEDAS